MRRICVFNNVSLDGYFTRPGGDLDWAYAGNVDAEFYAFIGSNAQGDGELLFGRITYEMMAGWWPTPEAMKTNPAVAEGMNRMRKMVFSRTLKEASWSNTTLLRGDPVTELRRIKREPGLDIAILGSGSIVSQLAQEGLIDEYQLVVNPVVLGEGRTMFDGVARRLGLKLTQSRTFGNGKVFLRYAPV
jgi:dihydrofolate reductase